MIVGFGVILMRLSDTEDMVDVSKEWTMFDVTSESSIWLVDISSDSVMVLES